MKAPLNSNWSQLVALVAAMLVSTNAQVQVGVTNVGRGLQKEIQAIKQPIDETITSVGNSQCANVKKLIGVDYEQVAGVKEPDLNELTLNFRSRDLKISYNLTTAARSLTQARGINPQAKLIIYIHGFTDDPSTTNFGNISEAFLNIGEFNILGLDASSLIRWLYLRSTTYVRFIGARLGDVLVAMIDQGLDPGSVHLIGHSLGAHIAGFAGKRAAAAGARLGRLTALDPAGPCFSDVEPALRVQAGDARFVDVIHTDGGVFGLTDPIGHVDFYPNGGSQQPNCLLQTCSHSRVNELYAESIMNKTAFIGKACADYDQFRKNKCKNDFSIMGYGCDPATRGKYYLRTGEEPPYGLREEGLKYENNEGIVRNIGNVGANLFG